MFPHDAVMCPSHRNSPNNAGGVIAHICMQWLGSAPSALATLLFLPMTDKGYYFNVNLHDFQIVVFYMLVGLGCFDKMPQTG